MSFILILAFASPFFILAVKRLKSKFSKSSLLISNRMVPSTEWWLIKTACRVLTAGYNAHFLFIYFFLLFQIRWRTTNFSTITPELARRSITTPTLIWWWDRRGRSNGLFRRRPCAPRILTEQHEQHLLMMEDLFIRLPMTYSISPAPSSFFSCFPSSRT